MQVPISINDYIQSCFKFWIYRVKYKISKIAVLREKSETKVEFEFLYLYCKCMSMYIT